MNCHAEEPLALAQDRLRDEASGELPLPTPQTLRFAQHDIEDLPGLPTQALYEGGGKRLPFLTAV